MMTRICLLAREWRPDSWRQTPMRQLPDLTEKNYERIWLLARDQPRMLDEIANRNMIGEILYLESPGYVFPLAGSVAAEFVPKRIKISQEPKVDILPDIVILRNSFPASFYQAYKSLFDRFQAADVTVVNDFQQQMFMNNKAHVYRACEAAHVPIPKTIILPHPASEKDLYRVTSEIGYPCVVKLPHGYEGNQVELCKSADLMEHTIQVLLGKEVETTTEIIFQEYIADSFHTYSTHVVGDIINAVISVGHPNSTNSFKASGALGNMKFQYRVDDQLRNITQTVMKMTGLDFVKIDFVKKNGEYLLLEANVSGRFSRIETANRTNIAGALVDHAITVHNKRKAIHQNLGSGGIIPVLSSS